MLIICIETISPTSYGNRFTQHNENPFLSKINCEHWAKDCYLMSSKTIAPFINNEETDSNPLVALAHCYISQQTCLISVEIWRDPMIQSLYRYAWDVVEDIATEKETTLTALQTISSATNDQFTKIREQLQQDPPNIKKALKYTKDGAEYCYRLKRQYDNIAEADDDDPPTPMQEPNELFTINRSLNGSNASDNHAVLMEFIENYKAENPGRMQWQKCWEKGVQEGKIMSYDSGWSLKRKYNKFKKSMKRHA
jgi:hypothetical protein